MHDEKLIERSINSRILEVFVIQTLLPCSACEMHSTLPDAVPQFGNTLDNKFRKLGNAVVQRFLAALRQQEHEEDRQQERTEELLW